MADNKLNFLISVLKHSRLPDSLGDVNPLDVLLGQVDILDLRHSDSEDALVKISVNVVHVGVDGQDERAIELEARPLVPPHLCVPGRRGPGGGSRVGEEDGELGPVSLDNEVIVILGVNSNMDVRGIETRSIGDDEIVGGGFRNVKSMAPGGAWLNVGGERGVRRMPSVVLKVRVARSRRGSQGLEDL